jgi:P-type Ca2+ transporter type 2C
MPTTNPTRTPALKSREPLAGPDRSRPAWHSLAAASALAALDSSPDGLSEAEAALRLARDGPNRLTPPPPASVFRILADQFRGVVTYLLVAATVISILAGDHVEAAAIAVVLVVNAGLGFVIELRARRAMEALVEFEVARATVVRGGRPHVVPAEALVAGDLVELKTGQIVPADARLVSGADLRTNEAALTGESMPVSKDAAATLDAGAPLADRVNVVYKGTMVVTGTARAMVVATGNRTEIGKVGALVGALREEPTPIERRLDVLGRRLAWLAIGIAGLVAILSAWQGEAVELVFETGIALAVAAVPEALPAVATIALAIGLRRMARRRALVRRLPAVEALGSTTLVCTDKTRTLTSGEMRVVRLWCAGDERDLGTDGEPLPSAARHALEVGALASQHQAEGAGAAGAPGDPVDAALLAAAGRTGLDLAALRTAHPSVALIPFSSERRLMASIQRAGGGLVASVKGAPERLLDICDREATPAGELPLDEAGRERVRTANRRMAAEGLRVLAVATGPVASADEAGLRRLAFVGLVGIMDPPARGVRETVAVLRAAGLRTIMLTGDQRTTAEAIGRSLGLFSSQDAIIDRRELGTLGQGELEARLATVGAFSRVTPEDKLQIVDLLQRRGEIVAMLGDGVNDAAALKKADVGVAMGIRGTDIAKSASDIVLQDDRFETIAAAVEEGRIIYDNIRKFVFYLFSCNVAEVAVFLVAGLADLPLPLLPLQVLWLNLVTDTFPALALAMEPGDADVMRRRPRDPDEALLSRTFLSSVVFYGLLITASALAASLWALAYHPAAARTISFMTLAFAQILHLGNARGRGAVLGSRRALANPYALGAVALSGGLQLLAMYVGPLAGMLKVVSLGWQPWTVVIVLAAMPATVGQAVKTWKARQGS